MAETRYYFLEKIKLLAKQEKTAVIDISGSRERKVSYRQLAEKTAAMSAVLRGEYSLKQGDCCVLMCENSPLDFVIALLAVNACGACAVPLKTGLRGELASQTGYAIKDCAAYVIITDEKKIFPDGMFEGARVCKADGYKEKKATELTAVSLGSTPMLILYTSGSTGKSKGVPVYEGGLCELAENYNEMIHRSCESVTFCDLPLYHVFALITLTLFSLYAGGVTVLRRTSDLVADNRSWFDAVSRYRATHVGAPNYMLSMLRDACEAVDHADLGSIKSMLLSTEMIRPSTAKTFAHSAARFGFDPAAFTVSYGLTETSSLITVTPYMQEPKVIDAGSVIGGMNNEVFSVGAPVRGVDVIITDSTHSAIYEKGRTGEICIKGVTVLDGYLNGGNNDSFAQINGERYFCTGDLGFIADDESGELYICGRSKEILNIHGENYSPYYIEKLIEEEFPKLGKAAAVSIPEGDSESAVVIIEEKTPLSENEKTEICRRSNILLSEKLAVSPAFVIFSGKGSFSYTASRKLKRNAMRDQIISGAFNGIKYKCSDALLSEDTPEEYINAYICRALGIDEIDADTAFISLGMDSLHLQSMISQLNRKFSSDIRLYDLSRFPSVSSLSGYIYSITDRKRGADSQAAAKGSSILPLTDIQKAYLAGRNPEIDWGGVSCQYYFEHDLKDLDTHRFIFAVKVLMKRHEALRISVSESGEQIIGEDAVPPVSVVSASETELEKMRGELVNSTLSTDRPLFRIVIADTGMIKRVMILIDMICCDASGIFIFWSELMKLYHGEYLPDAPSYREYSSTVVRRNKETSRKYWSEKEIYAAPQLPYNSKAEKLSAGKFTRKSMYLSKERYENFGELLKSFGLTPTTAFLALFCEFLSAYGAGDRFTLSVTSTERDFGSKESVAVIGDLTKVILYAVKLVDGTPAENAVIMQNRLLEDMSHTDFTHFDIMRGLNEAGEEPLGPFSIVFTSLLGIDKAVGASTPFEKDSFSQSVTPQVILDHQLLPTLDGGIMVCWDLVEEAFENGSADKMFRTYSELIERALTVAFWSQKPTDLRSENDRLIQQAANRTEAGIPETDMISGFHTRVKGSPDNTAVIFNGREYTYSHLANRADEISLALTVQGVKSGDRVMIQMDKSFELIAAIIGIVQIGAAYLPMPHDQPEKRQSYIYEKTEAVLIVSDGICTVSPEIPNIIVGSELKIEGCFEKPYISPDSLAYIIYTSGSTGKPKGAAITHRAAMNTIIAVNEYLMLSEKDRLIGVSSVSFDLSVYDIFGVLNIGAALVVPTEAQRIDPSCWYDLCTANGVTVWNSVPALMSLMLDYCLMSNKDRFALRIKDVILSGDWIPMDLYGRLREVMPDARLTSMGGATEASIWSNYFTVDRIRPDWVSIPYGYPLPNQSFHILDIFSRPCPIGVSGKLHIGGKGLAQGYYNEKELTKNSFYVHSYLKERIYDTGDYGRYDENGCIIFMGRKDSQIKINGYRIELGEIQSALDKVGYSENAVIVFDERCRGKRLYAFVRSQEDISEQEIAVHLGDFLPGYFIPERIFGLKELPHTANGKLDRNALIAYSKNGACRDIETVTEAEYTETDKKVLTVLENELGKGELTAESDISGLGATSLELIRVANKLESELGYRARVNDIIRYRRIGDFLEFYRKTPLSDISSELKQMEAREKILAEEMSRKDPFYDHKVMEVLRDELQTVGITSDRELTTLGLSSLSIIRLANRLEIIYNCRPSIHDMIRYKTIMDMIDFYESNSRDKTAGNSEITEKLRDKHPVLRCIGELLNTAVITENDSFTDLGVSSLETIRIANQLEAMYGKRPSMEELVGIHNFGELIWYYKGCEELKYEVTAEDEERSKIIELYSRCRDADIIIWPENGNLKFKAPQGALTPELREQLKSRKDAMLRYFSERITVPSQDLTSLQLAYVLGRQKDHVLGDITAHYYVEYETEKLDIERLSDAVNELIVRNEILRTVITPEGRVKVFEVNPGYSIEVVEKDGRKDLRTEMKDHQFPLGEWPMFDVKVTKSENKFVVHIGLDCLILDGWSINMFMKQLVFAYYGENYNVTDFTFRKYLEAERQWLRNKTYYHDAQMYWEKHIDQMPPAPRLPLRNAFETIKKPEFGRKCFELSERLTFSLFGKLNKVEMTPSLVLCTAYMMSLSKYSSVKDVMLSLTMFNRQPIHPKVQQILGDFTNIALIGYHHRDGANFIEMVEPVKKELWNAIEYRSFNVINLLGRLAQKYGDSVAAPYVFTSLIDSESEGSEALMSRIGFKEVFAQTQTPQVALDHQLYLKNGRLILVFDYVKQAFEDSMLDEMFADYTSRVAKLADTEDWSEIYE